MACVGRPSVTIQRPRAGAALYNPFTKSLDQVFEDPTFVLVDCARSGSFIQGTRGHFPNRDSAIEYWAESGLLKPDLWKARRTNLSLTVKLEMKFQLVAQPSKSSNALKLDHVPDSWPCNMESGWAAHYGRL